MIIDNQKNGTVMDALRGHLTRETSLSILTQNFSIFAFEALKRELTSTKGLRLLLSGFSVLKGGRHSEENPTVLGDVSERKARNRLEQAQVARDCMSWLEKKAEICAVRSPNAIPFSLFHLEQGEGQGFAIQGSSSLTLAGLGVVESSQLAMNTSYEAPEEAQSVGHYFDTIWENESLVAPFKKEFLGLLERIACDKSPQQIYYQVLHHLFREYLQTVNEEQVLKTKTGIKESAVWKKLYKFQKDGVVGAIEKLERHNGCIIADSVGLGKTFEALAIIKYYELRNERVLVLCPKKLRENWTIFTINDKRNSLHKDRFHYDVLNHTDLTRDSGMSGDIDLSTLYWGNYDLIVIDESHNFRNNNSRKTGRTRYSFLMEAVVKAGIRSKLLMLSATPVNNRMSDLKNQLALISEGEDEAFKESGIKSVGKTLDAAQRQFNQWLKLEDEERNLGALLELMGQDYFHLLDLLTIARSRKHIERYYNIDEIGKFPTRRLPINIKTNLDLANRFPPLSQINQTIKQLHLSAYSLLDYVKLEKRELYAKKYDTQVKGGNIFRQSDRDKNLIRLIRTNLLKRMESSINSFDQTVGKLLAKIEDYLRRIESNQRKVVGAKIDPLGLDANEEEFWMVGDAVQVNLEDMDLVKWRQDLVEDQERLLQLQRDSSTVDAAQDAKLFRLRELLVEKWQNPLNPGNRKAILFTAFADTARYLYENLADWAMENHQIHTALITGSGSNKTTLSSIKNDLNSLLTSFSPLSKERQVTHPDLEEEIDLLIATDCISEGQNLQDCDYLINYDIHWNPVRIIQRFGRIDRLGSRNQEIQLVNFWPNMELDEYINLEARVSGRMMLLDLSATGEENIIEQDERQQMNDLEYRRKQLKQLQENVVDIEEMSGGISLTDLTLNDFRLDLVELNEEISLQRCRFQGIHAMVLASEEELEPGALFCLAQVQSNAIREEGGPLSHHLVYVTEDRKVLWKQTQAKRSLDILKRTCRYAEIPNARAMEIFHQKHRDMSHYRDLMEVAISSIKGVEAEKGVRSIFKPGGTTLSKDSILGADDFELVALLIVL